MITAGGVGSGIDINGLVTQLVLAEAEPTVARFDRKEADYQAELSAFGLLKGTLSGFQTTLSGLKQLSTFQGSVATSDNDKDGNTVSKLVIRAIGTGSASEITVTAVDDDLDNTDGNGLSRFVYDPNGSGATNLSEIRPAVNGQIKIDGQTVTRSSNTISDAIDGVTIELVSVVPGQAVDLTIAVDQSKAVGAVNGFVESYLGQTSARVKTTYYSWEAILISHTVGKGRP